LLRPPLGDALQEKPFRREDDEMPKLIQHVALRQAAEPRISVPDPEVGSSGYKKVCCAGT
jgi:hypothetical protein